MAATQAMALLLSLAAAASMDAGLNLPARNGTSGTGAFLPGVYDFAYSTAELAAVSQHFTSVRLPINVPTAHSAVAMSQMHSIVSAVGGRAVICMFGTGSLVTHGTGRIDSMSDSVAAWAKVHATFGSMPGVKYEVFNEPHGYSAGCNVPPCGTPAEYLKDMRQLIAEAKLPSERCILDALGWAQDAQALAALGWNGSIGYHFYPWWLPANHSRHDFDALLQQQLAGISDRVYITEFGGNLNAQNLNYEQPSATDNDVNCLQGLDDGLTALRKKGVGIKGAFHWHGWDNGDSFSFWLPANKNGSTKVLKILSDASGTGTPRSRSLAPELLVMKTDDGSDGGGGPAGCNCTGRQNYGNWAKALHGKQHAPTTAACCAMCTANSACVMWEYDPSEGACWLKRDAGGCVAKQSRISGTCGRSPQPGPPPSPPPSPPPPPPSTIELDVKLDVTGAAIAKTAAEGFVSYCLDWWAPQQGARPEGWGSHANILEIDFNSPKLQALVRALGPSYLRIGGSLDKDVIYKMPGTTEPCPTGSERGSVPAGGLCLNTSRWDALHAFARATQSKVVFGLSYPQVGGGPDDAASGTGSGLWNSTQAEALFAYSKQRGYTPETTLFGFELGEELTAFKVGTASFSNYMKSYHRAAALLKSVFGGTSTTSSTTEAGAVAQQVVATSDGGGAAAAAIPKLMGPCPGMSWPQLATWFPDFLKGTAGALDIAVYHSYNQIQPEPPHRVLFLNETPPSGSVATQKGASAGGTGWQGKAMAGYAKDAGVPVWLGEGGPHNGGGGGEYASTFVSSFGYMDTLGTLAALNHSVFARQTLAGGNYELLRCSSGQTTGPEPGAGCDFEPHPDYWIALFWRRYMGPVVLSSPLLSPLSAEAAQYVRMYAHCTPPPSSSSNVNGGGGGGGGNGSLTVAWANTADSVTFRMTLPQYLWSQPRQEYQLTAANRSEGFGSRTLSLNNGSALTVGDAGELPPLLPRGQPPLPQGMVVVEPVSVGFVVFPDAKVHACM